jgi:hypothetical protein
LKAPVVELLKYMELHKEEEENKAKKEKMDRWLDYLSLVHSHPLGDADGRKKFIDLIKPDTVSSKDAPHYETDFEQLERFKAMQEGGKKLGDD